jgi:ArsR family transcriptional regulator, arsenate/arsenite/antimonite-responsive transcriptional repressor
MTHAKTDQFIKEQADLARFAKILSHPARIAIIEMLDQKKTCISGDISYDLPLSRTTISQHLQDLKNAGLIKGEISGQRIYYCIDYDKLDEIKSLFDRFFNNISYNQACDC